MSRDIIQLGRVALGTELIAPKGTISNDRIIEPVWVVGRHKSYGYVVVGWNGFIGGYSIKTWETYSHNYDFDPCIQQCEWGKEFSDEVWFITASKAIKHPEQKCAVCRLPAPHADPNTENGYVCMGCMVLSRLG